MVTRYFIALGFILAILLNGCTSYNFDKKFSHLPEKPLAGENLTILYNPETTPLKNSDDVVAYIYSFSHKLDTVVAIDMIKEGKGWICKTGVSPETVTLLVKFMDGDAEKEDNNSEQAYIVDMYDDGGNLPPENEAVSGVIKATRGMYAGMKTNREEGIALLKKSLSSNPELLKKFAAEYFYNLNRAKGTEAADIILGELAELEKMNDNSEDVLVTLTRWYGQVGDSVKSDEYEKLLNDSFPNNAVIEDAKYREINQEKNVKNQKQLLAEFEKQFPSSNYTSRIYYNIANRYIVVNDFSGLEEFVVSYADKTHMFNFYNAVTNILEKTDDLEAALNVSTAGVKRSEKEIVNPQNRKPVYYSDREWIEINKNYAAYNYLVHSKVLKEMDKINEALASSKRAMELGGGKEVEINEFYADLLLESEKYSEAISTSEVFVKSGSASEKIKGVLKEAYTAEKGSEEGYDEYLSNLEKGAYAELYNELKEKMIKESAAEFSLTNLDGNNVSLSSLKGKVVILDFWATWCGPCKNSFPGMKKAVEKFQEDEGVQFLFVNTWERVTNKKENAENFVRDNEYPFHVLMDEENKVVTDYGVSGIPTKFIIDGNGSIRFKSVGFDGNTEHLVDELSAMIQLAREGS